jgi:hypothetical protein
MGTASRPSFADSVIASADGCATLPVVMFGMFARFV